MKSTIIFTAAGTLIGVTVGFIIGKIYVEKKNAAEMDELRTYYKLKMEADKKIGDSLDSVKNLGRFSQNSSDDSIGVRNGAGPVIYNDKATPKHIISDAEYTHYHKDDVKSDSEDEVEDGLDDEEESEIDRLEAQEIEEEFNAQAEKAKGGIAIVSEDQANMIVDKIPSYHTVYLTYWAGDDILSDENDDEVINYEAIIGSSAIPELMASEYDNVIYVQNRNVEIIYEITLNPKAYKSALFGSSYDEGDDDE